MPIPGFQKVMRPLLALGADGKERNIGECIAALADEFNLSDQERQETLASGKQTLFANRVHWARTYLDKAGALSKTRRSHFVVTARGMDLLQRYQDEVTVKILRQFPEFIEFHTAKPKSGGEEPSPPIPSQSEEENHASTPDERIADAILEIQTRLESDLLDRISELSPGFFEGLVVDLIVAMGYGGSRDSVVQRIGKSGDEGIDGIVNEDPLGLDVVYIQAKKYDREASIGREKIQTFVGALVGKNATKGVYVATCRFTKGAIEFAEKVTQRVILIDGAELARLLVRYGVGVRVEREFQVKRIDLDYFDDAEG